MNPPRPLRDYQSLQHNHGNAIIPSLQDYHCLKGMESSLVINEGREGMFFVIILSSLEGLITSCVLQYPWVESTQA